MERSSRTSARPRLIVPDSLLKTAFVAYPRCMPMAPSSLNQMVTALVPSLSRSLAEQFNVFRVMHHGTHEKQLSNVFAWLLRVDGTHELGDAFQRLFVDQVNRSLPAGSQLPSSGYRVVQEIDTSGQDALGRDIADIVLTSALASVVVENFESSDGHGHDYHGYLAHGAAGGKQSVVVLLCARREGHRQINGWEQAVVVTYAELLQSLKCMSPAIRLGGVRIRSSTSSSKKCSSTSWRVPRP